MAYDKVVDSAVLDAGLKQIADAIREKGGTSGNLAFPAAMAEAVAAIASGGIDVPDVGNRVFHAGVIIPAETISSNYSFAVPSSVNALDSGRCLFLMEASDFGTSKYGSGKSAGGIAFMFKNSNAGYGFYLNSDFDPKTIIDTSKVVSYTSAYGDTSGTFTIPCTTSYGLLAGKTYFWGGWT